jgi:heme o synthase
VTQIESTTVGLAFRDYLEMCKPRVVVLMLITALVGMLLAAERVPPFDLMVVALVGIALVAGSAAVVNHVADAHVDRRMDRTRNRPMAEGRVPPMRAVLFSAALGVAGMAILVFLVNPLTAWLNLVSWVGYGLIYTLFLKRLTSQNIVIGGLFGAAPPLFGWTAITGAIAVQPLVLVFIIFVWTPAHFWALALDRIEDYRKAGIPMLPVTHGERHTRWQVFGYTLALALSSTLPWVIGMSGPVYLAASLLLNAGFIVWAVRLVRERPDAPLGTFRYSINYLGLLFLALLLDHYLMPAPAG